MIYDNINTMEAIYRQPHQGKISLPCAEIVIRLFLHFYLFAEYKIF